MSAPNPVPKLYRLVIQDVIDNVRDAFLEDGYDEHVLGELKQIWESKLSHSKAVEGMASEREHVLSTQAALQEQKQIRAKQQLMQQQQTEDMTRALAAAKNVPISDITTAQVSNLMTVRPVQGMATTLTTGGSAAFKALPPALQVKHLQPARQLDGASDSCDSGSTLETCEHSQISNKRKDRLEVEESSVAKDCHGSAAARNVVDNVACVVGTSAYLPGSQLGCATDKMSSAASASGCISMCQMDEPPDKPSSATSTSGCISMCQMDEPPDKPSSATSTSGCISMCQMDEPPDKPSSATSTSGCISMCQMDEPPDKMSSATSTSGCVSMRQLDGPPDSSDDEETYRDRDEGIDDEHENRDVADDDAEETEEPLNSDDDVSDDAETDSMFDTDNVVVCQYDKVTRVRNKWKFHLREGIMNLKGKDFVFQKASGEAEW